MDLLPWKVPLTSADLAVPFQDLHHRRFWYKYVHPNSHLPVCHHLPILCDWSSTLDGVIFASRTGSSSSFLLGSGGPCSNRWRFGSSSSPRDIGTSSTPGPGHTGVFHSGFSLRKSDGGSHDVDIGTGSDRRVQDSAKVRGFVAHHPWLNMNVIYIYIMYAIMMGILKWV